MFDDTCVVGSNDWGVITVRIKATTLVKIFVVVAKVAKVSV